MKSGSAAVARHARAGTFAPSLSRSPSHSGPRIAAPAHPRLLLAHLIGLAGAVLLVGAIAGVALGLAGSLSWTGAHVPALLPAALAGGALMQRGYLMLLAGASSDGGRGRRRAG